MEGGAPAFFHQETTMQQHHVNAPPPNPVTTPPATRATPPQVSTEPAPSRDDLREMRQRLAVMMAQPSSDENARQRDLTLLARMLDRVLVFVIADES
jgi:hypothetical protein